jgi:hypothetical protein
MILLTYKTGKSSRCLPYPCLHSAKRKADCLYKKGYTGIKVTEVTEKILYIPTSEGIKEGN